MSLSKILLSFILIIFNYFEVNY